ncbi:MAG: iron-containing alcohol dehydrogenase, partial [Treponema sp.]|nr:iron-containing alcohol dehydrogenase [Treponema sp.]
SHCINARYKISRSLITAIMFPYIIEDAKSYKTERLARLARLLRIAAPDDSNDKAASLFAEDARQRLAKANLPTRLKELSITIEQLALAAEDAGHLDIINSLPRSMTTDDLFDLIKLVY